MELFNIDNKSKVEVDINNIKNQEELDKLNDELNKQGNVTLEIQD